MHDRSRHTGHGITKSNNDLGRNDTVEIAIYVFCVMYSPGPVNILAMHQAVSGRRRSVFMFCLGVGMAMFTGLLLLGTIGEALVSDRFLTVIAIAGSAYILYLALQFWTAWPRPNAGGPSGKPLGLRTGFLLQLLNPKGFIVILPVTTVMFPAAGIEGRQIAFVGALISFGAIGAPGLYAVAGAMIGQRFTESRLFRWFNRATAVMLVFVACSIIYDFFFAANGQGVMK